MGSLSMVHWAILLAIVVLVFGAGRLPNVMGDFAKGIKAFRSGMREDDPEPRKPNAKLAEGATVVPGSSAP